MGKKAAEIAALREQVEALKAEVAVLKAGQISWPAGLTWPYLPAAPQCTCGTSLRCHKHYPSDWSTVWVSAQNVCAGAAPVPQTYIYNAGAATTTTFKMDPAMLTAGCAQPAPVLTLALPSGQ